MVCASEVYQWFKALSAHNRIEVTCSLLQLCLPNELTFISSIIEDMSNKDFEIEERCNSPTELSQYSQTPLNVEHVHKLCLTLSLLKPTNQMLAHVIYEILTIHFSYLCQNVMVHNDFSNDIMLLFALASYHPAFTFQCRLKLGECFATLLEIFNDDYKESSNNNNSALLNEHFQMTISVSDAFIERVDALVIIKISTKLTQHKYLSKRQCHFSQIKEFISSTFSLEHEFYTLISKLHYNGSFTAINIREVVNKIIKFTYSHSMSEEAKRIQDFFFYLPVFIDSKKGNLEVDLKPVPRDIFQCIYENDTHELKFNKNTISENSTQAEKPKASKSDNITDLTTSFHDFKNEKNDDISEAKLCKNNIDNGIVTENIYPINIYNVPCQPYLNYYFPNYSCYTNTDCCTSTISRFSNPIPQKSTFLTPVTGAVSSTNGAMVHQCTSSTLIPYNFHQSTFTPVHFLYNPYNCSFNINEPSPTIISNVTSSFSLSNVNSRSQTSIMSLDKQNIPQHFRDSSL